MKHLNRWVYAIVGVIVLLFAGLVYAWSVLSTPIAAEFADWSKAQLSMTFTIVMIMFCIGSLLCGLLSGKLSAKMSVRIGAVLFLLGFFLASRTQSLAMLYIGFGVLCGLSSGLCYNAVMSTMVRWFPDRPGLISGVLLMGFGGGSFIIGKLYQAWTPVEIGGWRTSFLVMGIIIFVVLAICSFFFVAPGADFVAPAAKNGKAAVRAAGREYKPLEMLKKPSFWLYYVWAIALSAAGLALISQASGVVWEASASQTAGAVATIVGLISICNALGRVLFGGMYDKYGRSLSMQLVNILFIITSGVLILALTAKSVVVVIIGFILGGLAYSGVTPTNSAFCRAYFGPANYPVNFSLINSNLIFASFGSTVSGALFDASGSYNATFFLIIGLAVVGILCSLAISALDKREK
ncbi:MAG: MFS transporter [Vescimonas sp.]